MVSLTVKRETVDSKQYELKLEDLKGEGLLRFRPAVSIQLNLLAKRTFKESALSCEKQEAC